MTWERFQELETELVSAREDLFIYVLEHPDFYDELPPSVAAEYKAWLAERERRAN